MRRQRIFPFAALFFLTLSAYASTPLPASQMECHAPRWKILRKPLKYCVQTVLPAGYQPSPENPVRTLFFMHGIFSSHRGWIKGTTGSWSTDFEQKAVADGRPWAAVSFDTGPTSFFADYRGWTQGNAAFETWFIKEFIPYVTKTHGLCAERDCRGLVAESMGGFGALKSALRYPRLFRALAVGSAALPVMDPFDSLSQWSDYFAAKPIGRALGKILVRVARATFGSRENFAKINPIRLAEQFNAQANPFPKLFIQCGGRDRYGFEDGFALFRGVLDQRGFPYEWDFFPDGGHELPGSSDRLLGFLFRSL